MPTTSWPVPRSRAPHLPPSARRAGAAVALLLAVASSAGAQAACPEAALAVRSLLNVTKYPVSLSFALMTLGPALLLLARWDAGFPLSDFDVRARFGGVPEGFGFPLWATLPFALGTTLLLYPACRWYDRLRASRRYGWTRYL